MESVKLCSVKRTKQKLRLRFCISFSKCTQRAHIFQLYYRVDSKEHKYDVHRFHNYQCEFKVHKHTPAMYTHGRILNMFDNLVFNTNFVYGVLLIAGGVMLNPFLAYFSIANYNYKWKMALNFWHFLF